MREFKVSNDSFDIFVKPEYDGSNAIVFYLLSIDYHGGVLKPHVNFRVNPEDLMDVISTYL